jgi:hypothetical protein
MIEALIAGQRDPRVLAGLARGRMKTKHSALVAALDGRFDEHHAELARMLLNQIDALTTQIDTLSARIDQLLAAMPDAQPVDPRPGGPTSGQPIDAVSDAALSTVDRLDEIPGIGPNAAQVILAEIGLDMSRFPTAAHLVSWAKLCPRTIQSGPVTRGGKIGKGNPYLKGAFGDAAAAAARPTPSSANATGASSSAAANSKPWSPSPAPSSPSSGSCFLTPLPDSMTSDPTTTPAGSTPNAGCATTSPNSPPWASGSPSNPPPDRNTHRYNVTRLRKLLRVLPPARSTWVFFRSGHI